MWGVAEQAAQCPTTRSKPLQLQIALAYLLHDEVAVTTAPAALQLPLTKDMASTHLKLSPAYAIQITSIRTSAQHECGSIEMRVQCGVEYSRVTPGMPLADRACSEPVTRTQQQGALHTSFSIHGK